MITKLINGRKVKLYDSIEDLPMANFQKFNRYMLLDSGIGSDFSDIDLHIEKIGKLMQTNKTAALQELYNMRQNLYYITENINVKFLAFITLIYEIDGKIVYDLSDDNIKAIAAKLNKASKSFIYETLSALKKNLNKELTMCFPTFFDDTYEKEVFGQLKQKAYLALDSIINEEVLVEDLEVDSVLPRSYQGKNSAEVAYMKQYEIAVMMVSTKTNLDPNKMNVFEFYSILEGLKKAMPNSKKK